MAGLTLTLSARAQIGDRARNDFVVSSYPFIPGWVVRGAFAAAWLARHGGQNNRSTDERAEFVDLFEGGVRFAPLYHDDPFPPLSVLSHKYDMTDDCMVEGFDLVHESANHLTCPDCRSPLEPRTSLPGSSALLRRRTHVQIGANDVAVRGALVTRETLAAGRSFSGHIVGTPGELTLLGQLTPVRVGGRRTTHGTASVRIDANAALPHAERLSDHRLVLRLRSPGVFVDEQGRPSQDPNSEELHRVLGVETTVERRWTRWMTIAGWHIASQLPKPAELAVAAGSTYVLSAAKPVDDSRLAELMSRGLGLRRHEGFGDLGGAPYIERGEAGKSKLRDQVAALRTLNEEQRAEIRRLAEQAGDEAAGIDRLAASLSQAQADAVRRLFTWHPRDINAVMEEWSS